MCARFKLSNQIVDIFFYFITMSGGHHAPKLNVWAIGAMTSVFVIYAAIKSPLKYKWVQEDRISPKADLAWRNGAQKWLEKNQ